MPQATLLDLSYKGLIRARGTDAVAFLQGQLSTDIEQLTPTVTHLSSWNTAKGRVVSLIRLFRRDDDIYLALPGGLKATVLKRLSMYVLRAKVALTDASDEFGCLGLIGDDAAALLAQAGIPVPLQPNTATHTKALHVLRLIGELPRYALYGPEDMLGTLKKNWEPATSPGTEDEWALRRILAGEPTVHPETSEHFVAQMLDLDKLGGIDFKKGCYIGQEIIARAQYRGGVKRHMVRAESQAATRIKPGTDIHAKGQNTAVAEVVDARLDEAGVCQMLLVIQDDAREMRLVHSASGAPVTLL